MMKYPWRVLTLLAVLLLPTLASAQTDPCAAPAPTVPVLNPTKILATLPEQTTLEVDGVTPRVTDYQLAFWANGANMSTAQPSAGPVIVAKTAWTLVAGTTNCYATTIPASITVAATAQQAGLKARRAGTATVNAAESAWSAPFGSFGTAPDVLAAPGLRIVRQ